jgi:predicted MFS family arabinose efflux permease
MMGGVSVVANILVASFSDRLGKQRAMLGGLMLGTLSVSLLARSPNLWSALLAIGVFVLTNDFGFCAYQVLLTELLPAQRGMVMSLHTAAWGLGVTIAPLLGSAAWRVGGFPTLALSMSLSGALAFVVALLYLPRLSTPALRPA